MSKKKREKGWECPKCGAVMAPDVISCINCKGGNNFVYWPKIPPPPRTMYGVPNP